MKKILSFLMALALITGLNAAPVALKQLKAPKSTSRMELVQKLKTAQPVTHQTAVKHAPKQFRHIDRTAMRKAPMAEGVTFTFAGKDDLEQSKSGISLTFAKGSGSSDPAWISNSNQLRVYANNTITVSGSEIKKIELTCGLGKTDKAYADMVADCGSLVSGGESSAVGEFKTDTWTGSANKVVFTIGTGQREIKSIVVYTDGDTPTPPTPSGDVTITGLNYADAIFYADETYGDYWAFDFYKELDEEGYILAPYVYFVCNESTTSGTKIAGAWTAYDSGYFATDDEESGIYTDETTPVGSLTVTCVSKGVYNFVGSFVGEDGKTYTWTLNNMEVYAYNGDTYEDITLTDGGTPTPGDTTALTMLDAFEFGYYASYSEEGAYNYSLNIYNSQDENYVPYVSFDIYTEAQGEFTGKFSAEGGNLGLDYSVFFPDAESEGEYFTSATVTITEGEGDDLVIEGIFTTEEGKTYTFSVTAEPYIYDAEHPYEPQEAKTFDLTAVDGETDDSYFADYGIVYYYLYMEDGSYVGLTYRTDKGSQPEGTFAISDEEGVDAFLTGMDYYGYADGSYYETIEGDVYYFVSGSVTLATDELGNTTITANATSCYGSTFTVTGVIGGKQPSGDHTIVIADYADVSFTTLDGAYTVLAEKAGASNDPVYNNKSEDLRIYANGQLTLTKNTKDGPMTKVIFNISEQGLKQFSEITADNGEVVCNPTTATVTWTGEASEIVFNVGDANTYGTNTSKTKGQFDFTSIDIDGGVTGLISNKAVKVASKCLINGQLMIIKNDAIYNFLGNLVK